MNRFGFFGSPNVLPRYASWVAHGADVPLTVRASTVEQDQTSIVDPPQRAKILACVPEDRTVFCLVEQSPDGYAGMIAVPQDHGRGVAIVPFRHLG